MLSAPLVKFLQVALQSHREALALDQDNADVLFNTAQVLTSIAEALTEAKHPTDRQIQEALQNLREALELFQRCLVLQELRYTEAQEQIRMMESGEFGGAEQQIQEPEQPEPSNAAESDQDQEQEQWAAVVEPVTKDTLVDTAVAQLQTLTALCNLLTFNPDGKDVAWVEEYSFELLNTKIAAYVDGSDRHYEVALARADFMAALSELSYRSGRIEVDTYQRELEAVFGPNLDVSNDPEGLCSKAEALVSLNSALGDFPPPHPEQISKSLILRWQALSSALDALTAASKHPDADNLPKIHIARGDAEMYRWRLGCPPWGYKAAYDNAATLLRNAQTYYRGAAALARRDGAKDEERDATCKEAIAAALAGDRTKLDQLRTTAAKDVMAVAEDMVGDNMVMASDLEPLLS